MTEIHIAPMSEGLRRQRRNLILISCVLCFMKYGGINITKTTVLGTEIQFSNSLAIFLGLWVIWIYFLVRYYQYFMQEAVRKIIDSFKKTLEIKCGPIIKKIVTSQHPVLEGSSDPFDYNSIPRKTWKVLTFSGTEIVKVKDKDYYHRPVFQMDISLWKLRRGILNSYLSLIFNKSLITDYVFPILFAIFTFIYCNIGNWPGNLRNIF